jgi:hypothetical protein
MDGSEHTALALPVSALLILGGAGLPAAGAYFAAAVLVDGDHWIDYWRETGLNFDLARFLPWFEQRGPRRIWLGLHGWEWAAALLAACIGAGLPAWVWALSAGLFTHLILDQRYNELKPLSYFFFWRWRLGFSIAPLYGEDEA